jgi:AcrR family transcriptional regulator
LRTEEQVVDAILDLLNDGVVQPTAQEVSTRSGVSMRSIFRLFQDVEALYAAAIGRQWERVRPLLGDLPATGSLASRIGDVVEARSQFFETVAPVRRFAVRIAPRSPAIQQGLAQVDEYFRAQLGAVFAEELTDSDRLDAVDAVASWETWDRLRRGQELSTTRARTVLTTMLTALLER